MSQQLQKAPQNLTRAALVTQNALDGCTARLAAQAADPIGRSYWIADVGGIVSAKFQTKTLPKTLLNLLPKPIFHIMRQDRSEDRFRLHGEDIVMQDELHRSINGSSFDLILKGAVAGSFTLLAVSGAATPYISELLNPDASQIITIVATLLGGVLGIVAASLTSHSK